MPLTLIPLARTGPKELILIDHSWLARPFSRSPSKSREKQKFVRLCVGNIHTAGQGENDQYHFSNFLDSKFVTLMTWVCFSFLYPSSQDLRANVPRCPSPSHLPQLLFFILPNARCCYLQSPTGDTCKYNASNSQKSQNQVKQFTRLVSPFQNCEGSP